MQNEQLELIIGENLAHELVKDDAIALVSRIKNLREQRDYTIPPVHITDEIKTGNNCYEIRVSDKTVVKQEITEYKNVDVLIDGIIANLDNVCKAA